MPRLIEAKNCPHCGEELPQPVPRACPRCAGSLQQRYLKAGCLSSAPKLLVVALGLWWMLARGRGTAPPRFASPVERTPPSR